MAGALGSVHAGMVGERLDAVHHEGLGDLLHFLAAEAIDDAAAAGVLFHEADDLAGHVLLGSDLIVEVGPVEGILVGGGLGDIEVLEDVLLHLFGGRGGERDHGHALDLIEDGPQPAVFRSEVMPPFTDAMGLVDGEEADLYIGEELHVLLLGEGFRRHV